MNVCWLSLVLFCGLLSKVKSDRLKYDFYGETMTIDLYLGTPPQGPLEMRLNILHEDVAHDFGVDTKRFNAKDSTTFKIKETIHPHWYGTDVVKVSDDVALFTANVSYNAFLVPGRFMEMFVKLQIGGAEKETFLDTLLKTVNGDRSTVVYIEESHSSEKYEGAVIFGDRNPVECSKKWKTYKTDKFDGVEYMLESQDFAIGKYHRAKRVPFGISESTFSLDREAFGLAMKQLQVNPRGRRLDCNTKTIIQIKVVDLEFNIGPDMYMHTDSRRNVCTFIPVLAQQERILLPLTALVGQCLRFDYERRELGFSPTVPQ